MNPFSWLNRPIFIRVPKKTLFIGAADSNQVVSVKQKAEFLSKLVTESMTHMGAVSSSYRFKCFAQDSTGTSFIVLLDLPNEAKVDTKKCGEIEMIVKRSAKARFEIRVRSLYWRFDQPSSEGLSSSPAPDSPIKDATMPKVARELPVVELENEQATHLVVHQPTTPDEMAALEQQFSGKPSVSGHPWRDTEILESADDIPMLGVTQYAKFN